MKCVFVFEIQAQTNISSFITLEMYSCDSFLVSVADLKSGGHLFVHTSYLLAFKFVEVVRVLQIALSGVSVFSINIDEDVGIGPSTQHVTSEDAHFIGVDCQTIQGMNY